MKEEEEAQRQKDGTRNARYYCETRFAVRSRGKPRESDAREGIKDLQGTKRGKRAIAVAVRREAGEQ